MVGGHCRQGSGQTEAWEEGGENRVGGEGYKAGPLVALHPQGRAVGLRSPPDPPRIADPSPADTHRLLEREGWKAAICSRPNPKPQSAL